MSSGLNIDLILIVTFLILNLVLGLWYSNGIKSMSNFALGNRNFSTAALTTTLVATWIGGSTFNTGISIIYVHGILALCTIGEVLKPLFTAYVLVPRMQEFLGKLSIAQVMGDIYGMHTRIITAICSIVKSVTAVAMQIKVFSTIFNHFFGISSSYATIISTMILIIYSACGGIRAVVLTDIFQFFAFGAFIPTLAVLIWNNLGNFDAMLNTLMTNPVFDSKILLNYHDPKVLKYYGVFIFLLIPSINPAMFHRVLIACNTAQASKAFVISSAICFVFWIFTFFIGLVLLSSNLNIPPNNLLPYIIDSYSYPGFKAMVITGIIAMIMSTADSHINSAAIIFVNDLCKTCRLFSSNKFTEIIAVRVFSIAIGIAALYMSMSQDNILDILLFGSSFYTSIVGVPLLFTILGFRSRPRVVLSGMAAGAITTYIWNKYFNALLPIGDIVPAMISNFVVMMSIHYLLKEPRGWQGPNDGTPPSTNNSNHKHKNKSLTNHLNNIMKKFTWEKILSCCRDETFPGIRHYIYCIIFTMASFLIISCSGDSRYIVHNSSYFANSIIMFFSLGLTTLLLYAQTATQEFKQRYMGFIWHVVVFFTLVIANTVLSLAGGLNSILTICFISNLVVVGILLRWYIAISMIIIGIPIAFILLSILVQHNYYSIDANAMNSLKWQTAGALYLIGSITVLIKLRQDQFVAHKKSLIDLENKMLSLRIALATKDQKIAILLNSKQYIFNNLSHEIKAPVSVLNTTVNLLHQLVPKYYKSNMILKEKNKLLSMLDLAKSAIERLASYSNNLFDLSHFARGNIAFSIEKNNLKLLMQDIADQCNKYVTDKHTITFNHYELADIVFEFDYIRLRQVILSLISNAIQYSPSGNIIVDVLPYEQYIEISIEDEGVGISADEVEKIFEPFEEGSRTRSPAQGRGLGLAVAREIIHYHNGEIWASTRHGGKGSKFTIRLLLQQPKSYDNKPTSNKKQLRNDLQNYDQQINKIIGANPVLTDTINIISSSQSLAEYIRTQKSIIVIDDDQSFLDIISLEIHAEGYHSTLVSSPFKAIDLIKQKPSRYSMIILDMTMPGKSGNQVLSEIGDIARLSFIPVVIITGYAQSREMRALLYSLGATAFIIKPHTTEDIRNLINRYLCQEHPLAFDSSKSYSYTTI